MNTDKNSTCCTSHAANLLSTGQLILRLVVGAFMLTHGLEKLSNFEFLSTVFPATMGMSSTVSLLMIIFAEVFCSILLMFGLFTRLATIPLMIGMAVAGFVIHANDPFNVKEMALLYLGIYVVIAFIGAGKFSIDYLLRNVYAKGCSLFCKK